MSFTITDFPALDLKSKGYVHIRGFLSERELLLLREDFERQSVKVNANGNYDTPVASQMLIWKFERSMKVVGDVVRATTAINCDMTVAGVYFSVERGIGFPWHQDHESFFIYQQHVDHLNFYIPVVKPEAKRSNLCLIPFDLLREVVPESKYQRLVGSGAARFFPNGMETRVCDDESDEEYTLPVNIEELKVTPELEAGDLLLIRGDVIHRTQDTQTARIAVSFRRALSTSPINRAKFISGGNFKKRFIRNNLATYKNYLDCFDALNCESITPKQVQSFVFSKLSGEM